MSPLERKLNGKLAVTPAAAAISVNILLVTFLSVEQNSQQKELKGGRESQQGRRAVLMAAEGGAVACLRGGGQETQARELPHTSNVPLLLRT